jgi:hypothetical protein
MSSWKNKAGVAWLLVKAVLGVGAVLASPPAVAYLWPELPPIGAAVVPGFFAGLTCLAWAGRRLGKSGAGSARLSGRVRLRILALGGSHFAALAGALGMGYLVVARPVHGHDPILAAVMAATCVAGFVAVELLSDELETQATADRGEELGALLVMTVALALLPGHAPGWGLLAAIPAGLVAGIGYDCAHRAWTRLK